jgi:hypothetical protein
MSPASTGPKQETANSRETAVKTACCALNIGIHLPDVVRSADSVTNRIIALPPTRLRSPYKLTDLNIDSRCCKLMLNVEGVH